MGGFERRFNPLRSNNKDKLNQIYHGKVHIKKRSQIISDEANKIMSNLYQLPSEIKNEFSVDKDGKGYVSQDAIGRLCGVTQQANIHQKL